MLRFARNDMSHTLLKIYKYYEPTERRIDNLQRWIFGSIGIGFMVLYGGLVTIVSNGWRTIVGQRTHLASFNVELEKQVQERTRELTEAHLKLQEYASQNEELAVFRERDRLARELHDSVTQKLYGQTMYAEAVVRHLAAGDTESAAKDSQAVRNTAERALKEMRLLIFELRPPVLQDGLVVAIQARLEAVEERAGVDTEFSHSIGETDRFSPEIEGLFYNIAREALNNILRHAQAHSISVKIVANKLVLLLEIADDGVGFEPEAARKPGGFGLRGMDERVEQLGGKLTVQSKQGGGTIIRLEVDYE